MIFAANSRYQNISTAKLEQSDGTQVVYLRRRFTSQPETFHVVREHVVVAGDRIDNLSALHLADPEQYWRICDANRAMRPAELTEQIGRRLCITMPEGVPGATRV